jgi:hypothetical protein
MRNLYSLLSCGILIILLFAGVNTKAAIITSTAAGGDWGTTTTWVGGVVPVSTDDVVIATTGAGAVTTSTGPITCKSLTINSGSILTMYVAFTVTTTSNISGTINFGSTSATVRTMTFTGNVTLNSSAVWNETTTGAAATFSFGGSLFNNATTFTAQNTTHTFTGTGKTIDGSTANVIPSVTINGTTTNSGTLTISTTLAGSSTLTNSGTLNFGGSSITPNLTATAYGNTVNYNGNAQTIKSTTYYNLTLSGSGAPVFSVPTINNNLTLSGTVSLSTQWALSVGGNLNIGDGTTFSLIGSTISVTGTTTIGGGTSGTLSISGASTTKTFTGNFLINSGGSLNESIAAHLIFGSDVTIDGTLHEYSNAIVQIAGSLTNNGTYTASSGAHTFSGTVRTIGGSSTISISSVTITGSYTINATGTGSLTFGALTISSSGVITIPANQSLKVIGTTTLGGTNCLVIQSNSSATGSFVNTGTITQSSGSAEVQQYLAAGGWHGISSPITNAVSGVFLGEYLMYYSEPTNTYTYISPTTTPLNPMQGYFTMVNPTTTVNFSGTLNTGDMSTAVTRTFIGSDYNGWNFVGNPYPSSIDLATLMLTWTNVDESAWIWDPILGNYTVYPESAIPTDSIGVYGTHDQYIPPMQAFFVHCSDPGGGTVSFTNASRVTYKETFLKNSGIIPNLLRIRAQTSINSYADELTVYFDPSRTNYYERGFDALKCTGNADAPQIYTLINDTAVTVNSMVFDKKNITVPMGFYISVTGTYSLNASNLENFDPAISVHLEDLKLNVTQDLKENPVYTFTYDTLDAPNRFILHFDDPTLGVKDMKDVKPVQIYSYEKSIYVDASNGKTLTGNVYVYDLLGKDLYQQTLPDQQMIKINLNVTEGYYLVKVVSDQGVYTGKVYLK